MCDIEDCCQNAELLSSSSKTYNPFRSEILPVHHRSLHREQRKDALSCPTVDSEGLNIIGSKIFLHTFGCSHNTSDGEYMSGLLVESGFLLVSDMVSCDVCILNSCTVKNPSEQHLLSWLKRAKDLSKNCIVAGCVPSADPRNDAWEGVSVLGVNHIHLVVDVVRQALRGYCVNTLLLTKNSDFDRSLFDDKSTLPSIHLPKVRTNELIEIIPINRGCLNQCTYCKTKHARGDLQSWTISDIQQRLKTVVLGSVREVRLTSEDTGAYGRDIGTNIVELLDALLPVLENSHPACMLRLGMTNPPYVMEHMQDLARILNHPRVFRFLHIPVQSGSNSVLARMRREYTIEEFSALVTFLRAAVPEITIATDVICGFPGEDDEEFEATLDVVRKFCFPSLFISQFYPRPGTPAYGMKPVSSKIIKERSRRMTELFNSYETNQFLLGTTVQVWIFETASDGVSYAAHTRSYTQVLLNIEECKKNGIHLGMSTYVHIVAVHKFYVIGQTTSDLVENIAASRSRWWSGTRLVSLACSKVRVPLRSKRVHLSILLFVVLASVLSFTVEFFH